MVGGSSPLPSANEEEVVKFSFLLLAIDRMELTGVQQIGETLGSLAASGFWEQVDNPAFVLFDGGSRSLDYLAPFRSRFDIAGVAMTRRPRQAEACWRAIDYVLRGQPADYLIWLEDDIQFCKNWYLNVRGWLRRYARPEVWCYSFYDPRPVLSDGRCRVYPTQEYYGAQCLAIRYDKLASLEYNVRVIPKRGLFDVKIRSWLQDHDQSCLLASNPSLVQHREGPSTFKTPRHKSQSFPGEGVDPKLYEK